MRAISLWEPWGSAIALGLKRIETRHWATAYRGPLAIHCAKTKAHAAFIRDPSVQAYFQEKEIFMTTQLHFGCVVAVCRLANIRRTEEALGLSAMENAFGNYAPGRFAWYLEDIVPLSNPVPWHGGQGFFNIQIALGSGQGGAA